MHILCLGGETAKFIFCELEDLQGSLKIIIRIWYTQGFLGISSGGLVAETVCVLYPSLLRSALPMLLWLRSSMVLLVSSGTILRGMESRPWLFIQSSTGPKYSHLVLIPIFIFRIFFCSSPGLSSLVWCLHWVSLLLVWGCKNYLGWATLWNIFLFRSNFLEIS